MEFAFSGFDHSLSMISNKIDKLDDKGFANTVMGKYRDTIDELNRTVV